MGGQESTKEIEKYVLFGHEDVKHSTRTGRPVKVEELDIDFRVPGLPHAVVKEAEHLRVQELVQRIENHPHRAALQADLQQNNVYNTFSNISKAMIRELGNVELFKLCETIQKYNFLTVFFIGIKELWNAPADNSWLTANPEESLTN